MAKNSFVLQALKILGPEEILKLSEVLHIKRAPLKMAAGEELVAWDEADVKVPPRAKQEQAKVLPFLKKSNPEPEVHVEEPAVVKDEKDHQLMAAELILWQREIYRNSGESTQKMDAFKGYKKSTEMYVVKTSTPEGQEKIRFASTNGVLVNKKQV